MTENEKLIKSFGMFQLTTDEFRKQDVPYIPNWNYELLADFILADRKAVLEMVRKPLIAQIELTGESYANPYGAINEALSEIYRAVKTMER